MGFVVCFGWGGFLSCPPFSLHFQIRGRAIHERWIRETHSSQQRGEGGPTVGQHAHRELAPTYPHEEYRLVCSHLRNMACHQLVDQRSIAHISPMPTSLILKLSNLKYVFKLRECQSRLLTSHRTPADNRKRDVEACVLTPSIPTGRSVGALWVAP